MSYARLNLVVIRSMDIERAAAFYRLLDLEFVKHRHGNGLEHYSCQTEFMVFEIYPQQNDLDRTSAVRLGFHVASVEEVVAKAIEFGATILVAPKLSEWGLRAVIQDCDGHRLELTETSIME